MCTLVKHKWIAFSCVLIAVAALSSARAQEPEREEAIRAQLDALAKSLGGEDGPDDLEGEKKNKLKLHIDESGMLILEGSAKNVEMFKLVYKKLLEELAETATGKLDIRYYRPKHIDVTLAKAVLDDVFNPGARDRQAQQRGRQQGRNQGRQQRGRQPPKAPEPEPERAGGMDFLGGLLSGIMGDTSKSLQKLGAGAQGVNIVAEKQRGLLIITAPTEMYPSIIGLLAAIDFPAEIGRDYEIIVLKKLKSDDVKNALEEVLGLKPPPRSVRRAQPRRGQRGGQGSQTERLAQLLEEQMLQLGTGSEAIKASEVRISSQPDTNALIVVAPEHAMKQIKRIVEDLENQEIIETEFFEYPLKYANVSDVATKLGELLKPTSTQRPGRAARGGRAATTSSGGVAPHEIGPVTITSDVRTNTLFVRALSKDRERIDALVALLDKKEEGSVASSYVLDSADAVSLAKTFEAIYGKRQKGSDKSVIFAADAATNTLYVTAPQALLQEIESKIAEVDVKASESRPRTIPILQGDVEAIAETLIKVFGGGGGGRGRRGGGSGGGSKVVITADTAGKQLIVSATDETFNKISELAARMDVPDEQQQVTVKIYKLKYAVATEVEKQVDSMLRKLVQSMRAQGGKKGKGMDIGPFGVTSDAASNSLTVMGTIVAFAFMDKIVADIDVESENTRKPHIIKMVNGDATEIAEILSQLIAQQTGGRGGRRGQTSGPGVSASPATNSLIVFASANEMEELRPVIDSMDVEGATGNSPQRIVLKHKNASVMADLCNQMFAGAGGQNRRGSRRGGAQPKMIPIIVADEATNSLIVRAEASDFDDILSLVRSLDIEDSDGGLPGMRIIQVAQGIDVEEMAKLIEDAIKKGEQYRKQANRSYTPKNVAVGADVRTGTLILTGDPAKFDDVEQLVRELEGMKQTGPSGITVINTKTRADDLIKVLEQVVEQRNKKSSRSRRR